MALKKLRNELLETVRQSRQMARAVEAALDLLSNLELDLNAERKNIKRQIIVALQAQDRLEQRCANIERVINKLELCSDCDENNTNRLWDDLTLDELSKPGIDPKKVMEMSGEVDLF